MKKVVALTLISLSALSLTSCGKEISYEKWKELAEAFSHRPMRLSYDDNGVISHDGKEKGYLYILDEPTTGLHFEDIRVLLGVLRQLVDKGNTVVIIEHNTDVIRACDHIIDLGPEGGRGGGTIVAQGTIEDIRQNPDSLTGRFI